MNWIDTALMFVMPGLAMKRQLQRAEHQVKLEQRSVSIERLQFQRESLQSLRKYEAASRGGRLAAWRTTDNSANAENYGSLAIMRARARSLVRDNPWAAHAVEVISTYVVGDGIRPQFNHLEDSESKSIELAKGLWSDWSESEACDFEGEKTLVDMQAAVIESVVRDGECFIVRHRLSPSDTARVLSNYGIKKTVPLALQLLESDYLDEKYGETLAGGGKIVQGIEYDADGRRVAYHFFKAHPGEVTAVNLPFISRERVRVPAERVLHILRRDRLHQSRGVTWFTKVMIRLRELDVFEDATLKKQQIAACFSAFIIDPDGEDEDADKPGEADDTIKIPEKMTTGNIEILPGRKDIRFPSLPSATDYPEFTKAQLRAIAAGLGLTYEALTQDLTNTNFSSGRMGSIGMGKKIKKWQRQIIESQMMEPIFRWWREAADLATPSNVNMAKVWTQWTVPALVMVDPSKEISAYSDAIDSNQMTLSEVIRSQGKDPDAVFEERAAELKRMKELGILPAAQGSTGGSSGASNKPNEESENAGDQK